MTRRHVKVSISLPVTVELEVTTEDPKAEDRVWTVAGLHKVSGDANIKMVLLHMTDEAFDHLPMLADAAEDLPEHES